MDQDQELRKVKWLLGAMAIFLISGFYSLDEMRYLIWGKMVEGHVQESKLVMVPERRGRETPKLSVHYSFPTESGATLSEKDLLPADWEIPGDKVPIQYIPGSPDSSRLAGHRNMGGVYMFLGSLAVIAVFLLMLYREAKAMERRPARRGR